jgi:hypothetical protein
MSSIWMDTHLCEGMAWLSGTSGDVCMVIWNGYLITWIEHKTTQYWDLISQDNF